MLFSRVEQAHRVLKQIQMTSQVTQTPAVTVGLRNTCLEHRSPSCKDIKGPSTSNTRHETAASLRPPDRAGHRGAHRPQPSTPPAVHVQHNARSLLSHERLLEFKQTTPTNNYDINGLAGLIKRKMKTTYSVTSARQIAGNNWTGKAINRDKWRKMEEAFTQQRGPNGSKTVTSARRDSGLTPIDQTLNGSLIYSGEDPLFETSLAGASPAGHSWPSSPRKRSPFSLNYVKIWRIFSSTMMAWPREKHKGKESTFAVVLKALQLVVFAVAVIGVAAYAYKYQHEADFTTRGQLYLAAISSSIAFTARDALPGRRREQRPQAHGRAELTADSTSLTGSNVTSSLCDFCGREWRNQKRATREI
ncbi:hypothetical protein EVAR_34669_1 [Eumeta japonica]|uniref:Uncharacterized protein n=1 Tax=Eumeta variegata TaxID=151549 RepID=A0A4C1VH16_EUMVA|nr:hypothetical protein EVAR_34669_1 [Eumeta japonica]